MLEQSPLRLAVAPDKLPIVKTKQDAVIEIAKFIVDNKWAPSFKDAEHLARMYIEGRIANGDLDRKFGQYRKMYREPKS